MNRYKKLYILAGVLAVACLVTFGVTRYEARKENIQNSGEVVLELPTDSVTDLSWEYDGQSLAFRKEDGTWTYDGDDAFPVDQDKIAELLDPFASFGAAFIIQDAEDLGQYGLSDPTCTIHISTEDTDYTILLGDYSTMDSQRYVSIGDGNVYLVADDPLDLFDAQLSELIQNDEIPDLDTITQLSVSGPDDYTAVYEEGNTTDTYRSDDVYFTQRSGDKVPLDTSRVEDYLYTMSSLDLTNYVTYNATEEEIQDCGLDDPEATVQVDYTTEDDDGNDVSGSVTLYVSRDPDERAAAQTETDSQSTDDSNAVDEEEDEITAYVRVGSSQILYQITGEEYEALMACGYDDLRHPEVLPADFADISQLDISLEGADYTITSEGDSDERTYSYQEEELDIADLQSALEALTADSFTSEAPTQKEEISLTVHLDLEGEPTVTIDLYRYDGTNCLAVVDGEPVCLVARSAVVDLVEAVNAIVLN